jgi:DNA invertase Pin-like site-specific DNA recombinase
VKDKVIAFPGLGIIAFVAETEVASGCDVKQHTVPRRLNEINKDKERGYTNIISDE